MKFNDYNLKLTHLWVDGFGWENTIFQPSDFLTIIEFPIAEDGSRIFYGYSYNAERTDVIARKFKGIVNHRCHICGEENFEHTFDCTCARPMII